MVRYADDYVCCFQYKDDANGFYEALQSRLGEFNFSIVTEKTKINSFGRFAEESVLGGILRSQILLTFLVLHTTVV